MLLQISITTAIKIIYILSSLIVCMIVWYRKDIRGYKEIIKQHEKYIYWLDDREIPSSADKFEVFHLTEKTAFIGMHLRNGNFHFIEVPRTTRTVDELKSANATVTDLKKKYFWTLTLFDNGGIGTITTTNLPAFTGTEHGQFDENEILKLNTMFDSDYEHFKFNINDPLHFRQQTLSQIRSNLISKL